MPCPIGCRCGMLRCMTLTPRVHKLAALAVMVAAMAVSASTQAQPSAAAVAGFNSYTAAVEARLAQQHRSSTGFLSPVSSGRLLRGTPVVEQLTPKGVALPGALLHHWRGTAFAPGARAADFELVLRDFGAWPRTFAPEVLQARAVSQNGDRVQAQMRVRQRHVITVVMDTAYDITFEQLNARQRYSTSRSTRIAEIEAPGTPREHALGPREEHGFLWRMNTYWSYEERDGGLYLQIESVSVSRAVPAGLGWVVGPFVESIPRESLEFTLRSACNALRKQAGVQAGR